MVFYFYWIFKLTGYEDGVIGILRGYWASEAFTASQSDGHASYGVGATVQITEQHKVLST